MSFKNPILLLLLDIVFGGHGSKEKERKSLETHNGQLRTAVTAAVVGNPVSRQNPFFMLFWTNTSKTFL